MNIIIKRYLFPLCCVFLLSLTIPSLAKAEIFYIMPRLGLNITLLQDAKISSSSSNFTIPDTNDATFALSLAGGIHFSRIPIRLELDLTFRTETVLNGASGYNTLKSKTYQLTTMINAYYDIYLSNVSLVPYVGVGVGFTSFFVDSTAIMDNINYTTDVLGSVDFAWNVVAGFSYPVSNFLIDFAIRFVDSGKPKLVANPLSSRARVMGFDFLLGLRIPL